MKLDDLDRRILALLQDDCRITSEAISARIGLSPTAVQRRIKRLREDGAIVAEVAVVAPAAVGQTVTAIVGVTLVRGSSKARVDAFKHRIAAHPAVQQVFYVAGDHDFVLVVTASSMEDYEQLSRALFFDDANVQKFHTTFVMDVVKRGLRVPLG